MNTARTVIETVGMYIGIYGERLQTPHRSEVPQIQARTSSNDQSSWHRVLDSTNTQIIFKGVGYSSCGLVI